MDLPLEVRRGFLDPKRQSLFHVEDGPGCRSGLTTECVRDCAMEGARQTAPPQLGIGVGVGCGWRVEKGGSFDVVG